MNREDAKKEFIKTQHIGWLKLIDIIFDTVPEHIEITEVYQKYAWLEVRYKGIDDDFAYLVEQIRNISQYICEICGKSGAKAIIDGWDMTLCREHYNSIEAKVKYGCDNFD